MGNIVVDEKAQKRINNSKHKQKVLIFLNIYGVMNGAQMRSWAVQNLVDYFQSITYNKNADPSVRNNRQQMIDTLQKAHDKDWRMYFLIFTDVVDVQKNQVVSSLVKWTGPKNDKNDEYYQVYYKYDAIFNKSTGNWLRSAFEQFIPDKKLFKQYPQFQTIGSTRPISSQASSTNYIYQSKQPEPQPQPEQTYGGSSNYNYGSSSSNSTNDYYKQRQQQRKKEQEQSKKRNQDQYQRNQRRVRKEQQRRTRQQNQRRRRQEE